MNERAEYEIRLKDKFSNPLGQLEGKMNHFEGKVGGLNSAFQGLGGSIAGAFAGGLIAGGIASLISGLKDISTEAVQAARDFTNLKDAIIFASGSRAGENIEFLNNEIDRLGLDMNSAYKGFKTFQGGLMGTRLEGEKGLEIFRAVSEAATVMKLSADQTEGAFLALGQMVSKGNVQAEELRGQLGERLPGAFNIFARALGVSTAKLNDMLKDGTVIAEETLPLFAAELRKTFSPGVAKAQLSFNANMNRFNNFVNQAKISLGNGLIPIINDFISIIPNLDFSPLMSTFKELASQVKILADQFRELFSLFGVSISNFEAATIALRYFSYLMRVAWTPIRVGIQLYTQFVTLVVNSVDVFKGLGTTLEGIFTKNIATMALGVAQMEKGFEKMSKDASAIASDFIHNEKTGWGKIFAPITEGEDSTYANGAFDASKGSGATSTAKDKSKAAGVEKISSGTRNVTLNINHLIDRIVYEMWTGNPQEMTDMVRKAVLAAVNDVNIQN